jgi:hypothetical protein
MHPNDVESGKSLHSGKSLPTQPRDCAEQGISAANATLCSSWRLCLPELRVPDESCRRASMCCPRLSKTKPSFNGQNSLQLGECFVRQFSQEVALMYLRLAFWTLAMAYSSVLLSRGTGGASPSTMITAALLGAVFGFSLGGMFVNRRMRKRG